MIDEIGCESIKQYICSVYNVYVLYEQTTYICVKREYKNLHKLKKILKLNFKEFSFVLF